MFRHTKEKSRKNGHDELPFVDIDGKVLHEGDFVESMRYDLGICKIIMTGEGYVYESLEDGKQVNWARMIDARTTYQKVKKLENYSSP